MNASFIQSTNFQEGLSHGYLPAKPLLETFLAGPGWVLRGQHVGEVGFCRLVANNKSSRSRPFPNTVMSTSKSQYCLRTRACSDIEHINDLCNVEWVIVCLTKVTYMFYKVLGAIWLDEWRNTAST
jgi:hypothetical protein